MKAIVAEVGAKFADCFAALTPSVVMALLNSGVDVVLRYENLTADELAMLLDHKLLVGLLVTGLPASAQPSASLGTEKYTAAIEHFKGLSIPTSATVIGDYESLGGSAPSRIAYINAGAEVTRSNGFGPAAYIGAGVGLTSAQLYIDLIVERYLKGMSRVVDEDDHLAEPACGWCGYQVFPGDQSVLGTKVDYGILGTDFDGRALVLVGA